MIRLLTLLLFAVVWGCSKPQAVLMVKPMGTPADSLTAEPFLTTDKDGTVFMTWVERHPDTSQFYLSQLGPSGWTSPSLIASGSTWFINWADYPMLATDGNNRVAHVLETSGDSKYAYDVKVFTSVDRGITWRQPFLLHDDGKQAEHGFVSLVPYEGNVFAAWLDGRNTVMEGMDHDHGGTMSIRAAVFNYAGEKQQEWELDNKTCDCCQTAAAITTKGPVVVYRDRSDDEVRDISIVRWENGKWTDPHPVHRDNWKIAGCPVNGPRVASRGNSLAIAWFTAAVEPTHVNVVFSSDGGEKFSEAISIDNGKAIGRVDVEWIDDTRVVVSWMEGSLIQAAVVHTNGTREAPVTIAESSEGRSSGFPQMTTTAGGLVFAWTDDSKRQVKTALVEIR